MTRESPTICGMLYGLAVAGILAGLRAAVELHHILRGHPSRPA